MATAAKCAQQEYTGPASAAGKPIDKLWKICESFLAFVERRVFPGGCFFAAVAAEVQALPEAVRARIERHQKSYLKLLGQWAAEARDNGELKTPLDPKQVAFELHSLIITANWLYKIHGDITALERAWDGVRRLLGDPTRPRSQETT